MANTSSTYVGDGVTSIFALTFPYLDEAHVKVVVNNRILEASEWTFVTSSSIQIISVSGAPNPPAVDDAVVVKRVTQVASRLVDFQPGSILTESNLDLDSNQLFYLIQENQENYSDIIDEALQRVATANGITDLNGDGLLDEVVAAVLLDETAANIQQRIADIDANGALTAAHGILFNFLGASNAGATAFVLDTANIELDSDGGTLFSARLAAYDSDIAGLDASVTTLTSIDADTRLGVIEANYGVSLNVGGYITGFNQMNDGSTGTFDILTDKFRVVDPASGGQNPVTVFAIEGGNVYLQNLLLGTMQLSTNGYIRSGQTAWDTGTGFWLGHVSGVPKFSMGNDVDNSISWSAATGLVLRGQGALTEAKPVTAFNATGFTTGTIGGGGTPYDAAEYTYAASQFAVMHMNNNGAPLGTSNANTFTITGISTNIRPGATKKILCICQDNGVEVLARCQISSSGTMTFAIWNGTTFSTTGWTTSGTKGLSGGQVLTWAL